MFVFLSDISNHGPISFFFFKAATAACSTLGALTSGKLPTTFFHKYSCASIEFTSIHNRSQMELVSRLPILTALPVPGI